MIGLLIFGLFLNIASARQTNFVGGYYSSQADAAVARVGNATSPFLNPAGLGKIKKDSISSGASSFNATERRDSDKTFFNSSTNHVSYIKNFEDFNLGFMIYTISSGFKHELQFDNKTTLEGFPRQYSSTTAVNEDNNYYIINYAPKNSFWGASFNLISFNYTVKTDTFKHAFSDEDASKRDWQSTKNLSELNLLATSLSLGFQKSWRSIRFGLRLESPAYIIRNESQTTFNAVNIGNGTADNVFISSYNYQSETESEEAYITQGRLSAGIAYAKNGFSIEGAVVITPANSLSGFRLEEELESHLYTSSDGTYTTQTTSINQDSGEHSKAQVSPSLGAETVLNEKTRLGFGVSYAPTESKRREGFNEWNFTSGVTRSHKNYLGTFTLYYTKAEDAGNNVVYNEETEKEEKTDIGYSSVGFIFSGSYYF